VDETWPMADASEGKIRVLLLGSGGTGKSSLVSRLLFDSFEGKVYRATIEDRDQAQIVVPGEGSVSFEIIDSSGQEEFRALAHSWLEKSDVVMVCYAYDSDASREKAKQLLSGSIQQERDLLRPDRKKVVEQQEKEKRKNKRGRGGTRPLSRLPSDRLEPLQAMLVATKSDLTLEPNAPKGTAAVLRRDGEMVAIQYDIHFVETSSKTGEGVHEAFEVAVRLAKAIRTGTPYEPLGGKQEEEASRISDPLDSRTRGGTASRNKIHGESYRRQGRSCDIM
jgi:GTPase SAR1 family protein